MSGRFQPIREAICHHVIEGRVTDAAAWTYVWMILRCFRGVIWTCAPVLASDRHIKTIRVKKELRELRSKGYLRDFQQRGSRGSYPILIHKYEVREGDKVYRLDAHASSSLDDLVWVEVSPRAHPGTPEGTPEGTSRGTSKDTSNGTTIITHYSY